MVQFDWQVGEIVKELKSLGIYDNTLIMMSSDNGPVFDDGYKDGTTISMSTKDVDRGHDASGEYRGGKYQILEGGTRVPFIISWPAKIKAKQVSHALVNQIDFMASFAAFFGINLGHEGRDSRNLWSAFIGESPKGHEFMLEEAPRKELAIRKGSWKYIQRGNQLFDLSTDKEEKNNLARKYPEILKELKQKLAEARKKNASVRALLD